MVKILSFDFVFPESVRKQEFTKYFVFQKREGEEYIFLTHLPVKNKKYFLSKAFHPVIFYKPRNFLGLYNFNWIILKYLFFTNYDLIICNMLGSFPTLATLLAHFLRKKPYIVNCENWYLRKSRLKNFLYHLVTKNALAIGYQSSKTRKFMREKMGIDESRLIKDIDNLEDISKMDFSNSLYHKLKHEFKNKIVILSVGHFKEVKGHDILIKAFIKINADAKLIIIGSDKTSYGMKCKRIANKNVIFTGKIPFKDVLAYYRIADIFVLANKFTNGMYEMAESFGYAPMEAMFFETPVIVTDATGCSDDIIVEGVTGFKVKSNDVNTLKEKLEFLIFNPKIREKMGKKAREHVVIDLNPKKILRDYLKKYNKILDSL